VRTTTGDAEGEVVARSTVEIDAAAIDSVMTRFRGEMEQVPPMHSALKYGGRPLYEIARKGFTVPRAPRRIAIRELEMLGRTDETIRIRVSCSKGTYVRVLAEDIGAALGCGAHLASLRRTAAGCFRIAQAVTLEELGSMESGARDRQLLPVDKLLQGLPPLHLDEGTASAFVNGRSVGSQAGPQGRRRVYAGPGHLLGVGEVGPGGDLRPLRIVARSAHGAQAAEIPRKTL
jgi:tRNA pseudouridine55 synthase